MVIDGAGLEVEGCGYRAGADWTRVLTRCLSREV